MGEGKVGDVVGEVVVQKKGKIQQKRSRRKPKNRASTGVGRKPKVTNTNKDILMVVLQVCCDSIDRYR